MSDKQIQKRKYPGLHKFSAAVSLLTFLVIIISGMQANVGFETITYRSFLAMLVIGLISRILVKAWASFEELDRG